MISVLAAADPAKVRSPISGKNSKAEEPKRTKVIRPRPENSSLNKS